jgi:hypothetical protein
MKAHISHIQSKYGIQQILLGIVLVIPILGKGAQADDLFLSEARDISDLGMTEIYVQEPEHTDDLEYLQR